MLRSIVIIPFFLFYLMLLAFYALGRDFDYTFFIIIIYCLRLIKLYYYKINFNDKFIIIVFIGPIMIVLNIFIVTFMIV